MWDESVEGYLIQHASPTRVDDAYRPVLIYRYRGTNRAAFTAVGTWFEGTNGPVVATVEHLLQPKFSNELFVIRFLSPDEHAATNGIVSVVCSAAEAGLSAEEDVVFLRPKPESAQKLPCFSKRNDEVPSDMKVFFFDKLVAGGRTIRHIRSLVTGIEYPFAGATQSPQGVVIRFPSKHGHSGTGFVDEYRQLYILSHSPKDSDISVLHGPYSQIWKRL